MTCKKPEKIRFLVLDLNEKWVCARVVVEHVHPRLEFPMRTLLGVCVVVSKIDQIMSVNVTTFNPYAKSVFTHASPEVVIDKETEMWAPNANGEIPCWVFGELIALRSGGIPIKHISVVDPAELTHIERLMQEINAITSHEMKYFLRQAQGFVDESRPREYWDKGFSSATPPSGGSTRE